MTLYNARVQQAVAAYSDAKMLVLSRDEAELTVAQTDFIFDFLNPAGYPGGALPANGAAVAGAISNLARDAQPAIVVQGEAGGRTAATTLVPFAPASAATFNGKGLLFANGSTIAHTIKRAGTADNLVTSPQVEGFVDFVEVLWVTPGAPKVSASPYFRIQSGGFEQGADGKIFAAENAGAVTGALGVNALAMLVKIVRFNTGAGTSTIRIGVGAGGSVTIGAAVAGRTTASYPTGGAVGALVGGRDGGNSLTFAGTIHRLSRHFAAGWTDAELIARFQTEYGWGQARFA